MHDSALAQKLDKTVQTCKQILEQLDHLCRLIERTSRDEIVPATSSDTQLPREKSQLKAFKSWNAIVGPFLASVVTLVGLTASVFSFFPRLSISDPVQMDPTDLFSYKFSLSNGGVLPVHSIKWALAPRSIRLTGFGTSGKTVGIRVPLHADFQASRELMARATKPGPERVAIFMFNPGTYLTSPEHSDFGFHLSTSDNSIAALSPGDETTLTTEGLMSAPPEAIYEEADFAIAITYVPIFPPIQMQTCFHFQIFNDRQGKPHWFRAANQCDRFPWTHTLFAPPERKVF